LIEELKIRCKQWAENDEQPVHSLDANVDVDVGIPYIKTLETDEIRVSKSRGGEVKQKGEGRKKANGYRRD
jgi:hypothetical protein